ncbi:hypothetical protein [Streptomyces fuscichromogenes]|uniref:Uncharacterized protein n=1 Tax=Streptomyces fuscichromogenes TaxID=1324013 RepID=A0A918CXU3_9ACTN|nr:hypothetical protein [Streptomyces fuscichromogenes]GGN47503.1 hypothetical protein GCM10011578_101090 [Streptomyces fuscichromogenes]
MTFTTMLLIGAVGGAAGVLTIVLVIVLAILGLDLAYKIRDRFHDASTALRARADFRATRRDIGALPTAVRSRDRR